MRLFEYVSAFLHTLKRWEVCELNPYLDKDNTLHAGWGTGAAMAAHFGITLESGKPITQKEADYLLRASLHEKYVPELNRLVDKAGIDIQNNYQFSGLLDVYYNRGGARLAGADHVGCPDWLKAGSKVWSLLKTDRDKYWIERANRAIVFSHDGAYNALDIAQDKTLPLVPGTDRHEERVYLGLELRRIDDGSIFGYKE